MESVSVRELRNNGGAVLDRVARGASLVVTRDGAEVAVLRPWRRPSVTTRELIARRRHLPPVDPGQLRADTDEIMDPAL